MKKKFFFLFLLFNLICWGQELNATVNINYAQINTSIDRTLFDNLKKNIINFFNKSWTNENFAPEERINCTILLIVNSMSADNVFNCKLNIQASRPVWNTNYNTSLLTIEDANVNFSYTNYQYFDFNETQVSNINPLSSNLPSILAYYIYIILGMNFDSFSLKGGTAIYQKALTIVNNAPQGSGISGWKATEASKNRYWLINELTMPKTDLIHEGYYLYYRGVLDNLYDNKEEARKNLMLVMQKFNEVDNQMNGNSMLLYLFFLQHAQEVSAIIKNIDNKAYRSVMLQYLGKMNPGNYAFYKKEFNL